MSDPNILLNRAKAALLARDYQLAAKYYKTLIFENPDVVDYKIQLGNLYVKAGKDDQALDVFKTVTKKDYDNLSVLMSISGIYRRQQKFDDSVAVLEQALMVCANSPEDLATINYNLGFTYRQMGGHDNEAIRCFEEVIEHNPKDVLAYNHLGAIHALQGNHDKAIESYRRGLQFDPNHPVLNMNIAKSFSETGEVSKALFHYESALKAKPGWLEAIEEYANLLLKTGKIKEADEVVSQALKLNPDDVKMHTSMGNVYNRKSIFDDAEVEFKRALDRDDKYKAALTGLAHSLEKQGKHEEAAETINKVSELNPNDISILKQSAHVLLSANFLPAAYEKISRLWEVNPNDLQTINLLGQYYIAKGDEDKIESCYEKIQGINPEYNDLYRDWGARYLQKGDEKKAEQYLKAAIKKNARDAESMVYLAELYEHLNKPELALDMYKRASTADNYNFLSKKEISRLTEAGTVPINFDMSSGSDVSIFPSREKGTSGMDSNDSLQNNRLPDLLNDNTSSLNEDFEDNSTEEISMAEDDSQFDSDFDSEPEEEQAEKQKEKSNDDFDFDQFGMEKLTVEDPEEAVSIADLMHLDEDIGDSDRPDDIDELVDDGTPVDEEDDFSMGFIPEGSNMMNGAEGNYSNPDQLVSDGFAEEPEEDKFNQVFDEAEPVPEEKPEEKPVMQTRLSPETLQQLQDQIKKASELADRANENAEKAIKAAEDAFESLDTENEAEEENPFVEESESPSLMDDSVTERAEEELIEDASDEVMDEGLNAEEAAVEETSEEESEEEETSEEAQNEEMVEEETVEEDSVPFEFDEIDESEEEGQDVPEEGLNWDEAAEEILSEEPVLPDDQEEIELSGEELSPSELMMKRAIDILPDIVNAIEDRHMLFKFKNYLEMFRTLREMLNYLPEDQKKQFQESRNRLFLDYIISRLSGKPGLLATVKALMSSGIIHGTEDNLPSEKEGVELTKEVMEIVRSLTEYLQDESLREVLNKENDDLMKKL